MTRTKWRRLAIVDDRRELSLVIVKLEEALMWAERIETPRASHAATRAEFECRWRVAAQLVVRFADLTTTPSASSRRLTRA